MLYKVSWTGEGRFTVLTLQGWAYVQAGQTVTLALDVAVAADLIANGLTVVPA